MGKQRSVINFEHLEKLEAIALDAVTTGSVPNNYSLKQTNGCAGISGDIAYIRLDVLYDGVEVGDVGLALRLGGWVVAGSGYSPMP